MEYNVFIGGAFMKKYIAGLITGLLVSLSLTAFASVQLNVVPNPYPILVDGVKSIIGGYSINGSTYIKLADLKSVGINAKFNSEKKQIEIVSFDTTATESIIPKPLPDHSIPEVNSENNPDLITKLSNEDNVEVITYKSYSAIKYKDNIYIKSTEALPEKNIKYKLSGKSNALKLYKDNELILETTDANSINYVGYNGIIYISVEFLGKYLED